MFIDGEDASRTEQSASGRERAIAAFLGFIEHKLGVRVMRESRDERALNEAFSIAARLKERGVVTDIVRTARFADEPHYYGWFAACPEDSRQQGGGASFADEASALTAALAEALERHLWARATDHFSSPFRATAGAARTCGRIVGPSAIVGYSDAQRAARPDRTFETGTEFLWTRGHSLIDGTPVYVPAQTVSGVRFDEPSIRPQITNGLATAPTKEGARLRGALEIIERDAYMITWLNQLSLPRLSLSSLSAIDAILAKIFADCARYRFTPHVVRLLTDAPTEVVMTVLEDASGSAPRFTLGLKAHRSLTVAVERSLLEAFRARAAYRRWEKDHAWSDVPVERIGHRDRLYYWGVPEHAARLEVLIRGTIEDAAPHLPVDETEAAHLGRILAWCREKRYECVSVPLTGCAQNPTDWHIDMILMPQMQPAYLTESTRLFGGERLKTIPESFGYASRAPFTDAPHPFS